MWLGMRDTRTGRESIHSLLSDTEHKEGKKDEIQSLYDSLHGKGVYKFFHCFKFFKPFTPHREEYIHNHRGSRER